VNKTDCKHIKKYKDYLKGLVKESAMSNLSIRAFSDELQKIAARRGLKEIRKAVQGGDVARASRLAKSPGVLKATDAGSQIRDIGHGGEGLATMVAHPQHGVAVRKLYNPQAVTPELIARKEQAAQLTKNNPNVARMLGSHATPSGGKMHMMEYVHGSPVQENAQNYRAIQDTRKSLQKDLKRGGMVAQDVRPSNMIQTPSGKAKLVDYIPGKVGDFESGNTRTRVNQQLRAQGQQQIGKGHILATAQAPEVLKGVSSDMASAGSLKGNAFRGSALGFQMPKGNTAPTATIHIATTSPKGTRARTRTNFQI
jgi:serine/threonine protein kinase